MCLLYTLLHGLLAPCPIAKRSLVFNARYDIPMLDQRPPLPRLYSMQILNLYKHMTSTVDTFLPSSLSLMDPAPVLATIGTAVT